MQESQVQVQIQGQRQRQQSSYGFRSGRPCCLNWASSAFLALLLLMASTTNILTSVEASTSPTSSITSKYIRKSDLTDMAQNKEWQSLSGNVQFLPSTKGGLTNQEQLQSWAARQLNAEPDGDDDIYRLSPLVEGETEYDEYQTAWRLLGFMIDCDDDLSDALYDDQYRSGSGDGGDGGTGEGCHRYVIWAAVSTYL